MLVLDPIINKLQKNGGVSVYFAELLSRLTINNIDYNLLSKMQSKAYRYLDVSLEGNNIFHSSYYRIAKNNSLNITTVHDFTYEKFFSGPKRLIHSWQKNNAIRNSSAVICVSENTKRDLIEYLPDVDESKVFVVHNGVSHLFSPLGLHAYDDNPYVLFVGARGGYKNFSAAVLAIAKMKDIQLFIVGGGGINRIEENFLQKNLPNRFKHVGFVDTSELNILYNNALCLLYPSSYEGFGIPILEAMKAGCPVVALNNSSIPEVAGDAAILVENSDSELLCEAIVSLCSSATRERHINKGIIHSMSFSWDLTYNKTLDIYEQLLGRPLPKRRS